MRYDTSKNDLDVVNERLTRAIPRRNITYDCHVTLRSKRSRPSACAFKKLVECKKQSMAHATQVIIRITLLPSMGQSHLD